jgi:hypothetical protein
MRFCAELKGGNFVPQFMIAQSPGRRFFKEFQGEQTSPISDITIDSCSQNVVKKDSEQSAAESGFHDKKIVFA